MSGNFCVYAQRVFDGQNFLDKVRLTIDDGMLAAIDTHVQPQANDLICNGLLVPGFVDLQVNGGGGVLLNNTPSLSGIETIMTAHAKFGTTAMLPTLITDTIEVMEQAADAIAKARAANSVGIIGVHFEGPHLSIAKKGAHSAEYIRPISAREWQLLSRKDLGQILVTLAPENVLPEDVARMVELGIKVCLGHTNADYATAQKAVVAGADGFTHLFNAMSPVQGREPGVVGCALLNDHTSCGLIVDGHHVAYETCQLAVKTKPKGKVFLVTDAMSPVGTDDTEFAFFDRTVTLTDGKLISTTGELAGSVLDMVTAVKNAHRQMQLPLDEALRMASLYPAQYIGATKAIGTLTVGKRADMVHITDDFTVEQTWIAGNTVYKNNNLN